MSDMRPYVETTVCGVSKKEFEAYKRVQRGGRWNMFSREAQLATGLDKETYMLVIKNYKELAEKWGGLRAEEDEEEDENDV